MQLPNVVAEGGQEGSSPPKTLEGMARPKEQKVVQYAIELRGMRRSYRKTE